jgi:hypothetical protein
MKKSIDSVIPPRVKLPPLIGNLQLPLAGKDDKKHFNNVRSDEGPGFFLFSSKLCKTERFFFSPINSDLLSDHRLSKTWLARLWAVLALGHAAIEKATGQQEMENDSSLHAAVVRPNVLNGLAVAGDIARQRHLGNYGFLFFSHFEVCPRITGDCLWNLFLLGGLLFFLLSVSVLRFVSENN